MASTAKRQDKIRVQVDLTKTEATLLQLLAGRLSVRSRADLLQQAYGTFLWIVDEMLSGRRIVSVEPEILDQLEKYKELSVPAVAPLLFEHYEYLVERPETGRKQLYLKGQTMTVGDLVDKMRANQLSPEEAAQDMDLPLPQVKEALAYYETHQDLIETETVEEKQDLLSTDVEFELGFDPDDEQAMRQIIDKQRQALLAYVGSATTNEPDDASTRHDEYLYGIGQ
jgi:uncharacterized protein (DUF433 family)